MRISYRVVAMQLSCSYHAVTVQFSCSYCAVDVHWLSIDFTGHTGLYRTLQDFKGLTELYRTLQDTTRLYMPVFVYCYILANIEGARGLKNLKL
jgi:hypothetical protein